MKRLLSALAVLALIPGCSINKIAVRQMAGLMQESRKAFETENDLELAEVGLGANLKLLEGMSIHDPDNKTLNMFLAEGFAMYSLAFVEDKMEEYEVAKNDELSNHHRMRAINLYMRARDYAGKILLDELDIDSIDKISDKDLEAKLAKMDDDMKGPVFWFAFTWGSSMNLDRENLEAFSQINKVELMMKQVRKWDEKFYFGGTYIFEAIYYGGRSESMGGDGPRSKKAFETAMGFTDKKFLIVPYFMAKTYCVEFQDKACFDANIKLVKETSADAFPQQRLANIFAKKKAARLEKQKKELFID